MTNKKTIEGIRYVARDTQKVKTWDRTAYALYGSSAVSSLLDDAHEYQGRYEHEFSIYDSACIDFGKIDVEALRKQAIEISEQNDDDGEKGTFTLKEDEE